MLGSGVTTQTRDMEEAALPSDQRAWGIWGMSPSPMTPPRLDLQGLPHLDQRIRPGICSQRMWRPLWRVEGSCQRPAAKKNKKDGGIYIPSSPPPTSPKRPGKFT